MTASANRARREELLARCQHERYALVATTAAALAWVPRARNAARAIRTVSRLLRVLARNWDK